MGTKYGIGIIPPELLNSRSVCYCAGAGDDISFDLELIKKFKCTVHIFDPTPRARNHYDELVRRTDVGERMPIGHDSASLFYSITPEELRLSCFHPFGLWSEDKDLQFFPPKSPKDVSYSLLNLHKTDDPIEVKCKSVKTIMSMLGHQKINLLKLDIVGAEYRVVDSLLADGILPDILLIEFDEGSLASYFHTAESDYFTRITTTIEKLIAAGYVLTMTDDWNVTFVRDSAIQELRKTQTTCSGETDSKGVEIRI